MRGEPRFVIRNEIVRRRAASIVNSLPILEDVDEHPYQVTISRFRPKRSVDQNRRYWALVGRIAHGMAEYQDGVYHHPDNWHKWLAMRFLGVEPGPFETSFPKSTSKLSVQEVSDYMTEVEAWAAEQGIFLDDQ